MTPGELFFPSFQHALWGCPNLAALNPWNVQLCVLTVMEVGRVPRAWERQEKCFKAPRPLIILQNNQTSEGVPFMVCIIPVSFKVPFPKTDSHHSWDPLNILCPSTWISKLLNKETVWQNASRAWTREMACVHFWLSLLLPHYVIKSGFKAEWTRFEFRLHLLLTLRTWTSYLTFLSLNSSSINWG